VIEVLQLLHSLSDTNTRYSKSYYVRHLEKDEPIPQFGHGIPESPLAQREWIWIAFSSRDDEPVAILAASPMHDVAMLNRIYATPSAPTSVFVGILRKSLADIYSRGYLKWGVFIGIDSPVREKLLRLVKKDGGKEIEGAFTLAYGPTDIGGR